MSGASDSHPSIALVLEVSLASLTPLRGSHATVSCRRCGLSWPRADNVPLRPCRRHLGLHAVSNGTNLARHHDPGKPAIPRTEDDTLCSISTIHGRMQQMPSPPQFVYPRCNRTTSPSYAKTLCQPASRYRESFSTANHSSVSPRAVLFVVDKLFRSGLLVVGCTAFTSHRSHPSTSRLDLRLSADTQFVSPYLDRPWCRL